MSERGRTDASMAGPPSDAVAFVERFRAFWRDPDLDRDRELWADDVRLAQPVGRTTVGIADGEEQFREIFELIPDLRGEVHRWAASGDHVFIEFTLSGTLGAKPVRWTAVDRFTLRDGKVAERVSYFNPLPMALALARRPRAWRRWLSNPIRPSLRSDR